LGAVIVCVETESAFGRAGAAARLSRTAAGAGVPIIVCEAGATVSGRDAAAPLASAGFASGGLTSAGFTSAGCISSGFAVAG
jgi:hypothetical protein